MDISVVIPTCNRKSRLLSLLNDLQKSSYPVREVLIVDSSDSKLAPADYETFSGLQITYIGSEKSVCKQRNTGICTATSDWVFLCDDDIEVPPEYLGKLVAHAKNHPEAGALSGLVLQQEGNEWKAKYDVHSAVELLWKYIFNLGIWGEIRCESKGLLKGIARYYRRRGNHISKAGWPVITDFSGEYFVTPVYALGASLVRRSWLLYSPFDEVLDSHGIGDNYGVAMGFPEVGIHVVKDAIVYHHQEPANRLRRSSAYLRRILALDYFIDKHKSLDGVKRGWLLWSLAGNLLAFIRAGDGGMTAAAFKSIWEVGFLKNKYVRIGGSGDGIIKGRA